MDIDTSQEPGTFQEQLSGILVARAQLLFVLKLIAQDRMFSCEHRDRYAGGVVSSGNRWYSAQEQAQRAVTQFKAQEAKLPRGSVQIRAAFSQLELDQLSVSLQGALAALELIASGTVPCGLTECGAGEGAVQIAAEALAALDADRP